jgi:hypothetical protein
MTTGRVIIASTPASFRREIGSRRRFHVLRVVADAYLLGQLVNARHAHARKC